MSQTEKIRIGHSPDSDDAFMFYALAKGLIPTDPYKIVHVVEDIETLNQRALAAELELRQSLFTPTLTSRRIICSCLAARVSAISTVPLLFPRHRWTHSRVNASLFPAK